MNTVKPDLQSSMDKIWNRGNFSGIESYVSEQYTVQHDPGDAWEG